MKKLLLFIPLLATILIAAVFTRFLLDKNIDYKVSIKNITIPTFEATYLDFNHTLNAAKSLPFTSQKKMERRAPLIP